MDVVAYLAAVPTADVTSVQIAEALLSAIVLLLPFCALVFLLRVRVARGATDVALLASPLAWVAVWALALETLSTAGSISRFSIRVLALALALAALAAAPWWWRGVPLSLTDFRRVLRALRAEVSAPVWWRIPLVLAVALTAAAVVMTLLVTIIGAPNNPDSLAYHLPRVMWWLQQGELGSFVTSDPRQVAFPPLNSYLLLIFLAVPGNDLLVNFVQWAAAMVSAVVVILIARRVGSSRLALVITGILVFTIPSGITVATTTKADWLAALWPLVALAVLVSRSRARITLPWLLLLLGLSAALAGATKATSAVAVAVVVVLGIWWELRPVGASAITASGRHDRVFRGAAVALSALVGVLAGLLPQVLRTAAIYGNATGPDLDIVVREPSLGIVWGNSVRTIVNNIGVPPPIGEWLNPYLPNVLPLIGVPIVDDAALYEDASLQLLIGRNEDFATNPIHLVLGLAAAVVLIFWRRAPARLRYVSAVAVVTFVVSVGTVQWNLWTSRFLLGVIALLSVPLAWILAEGLSRPRQRASNLGVVCVVVVLAAALYGAAISVLQEYRPVLGPGSILTTPRVDQYFRINDRVGTEGNMQERVLQQAATLHSLPDGARVGLVGLGAQEYLVWRFLNPDGRLQFVNLEGPNGPLPVSLEDLDGVVCIDNCPPASSAG